MQSVFQEMIISSIIIIFIASIIWYIRKIITVGQSRILSKKFFQGFSPGNTAEALEKASRDKLLGKCWSILKGNWSPSTQENGPHVSFVHLKTLFDNDTVSGDDTYRRMM